MSDLEELLRRWAAGERAAAGPAPDGLTQRAAPRPWPVILAAAAAVVFVIVTAAMLATGHRGTPTSPATEPTAPADGAVVPWAPLPPGSLFGPTPLPAPSVDTSGRTCRAGDLSARLGRGNGGGGWVSVPVRLTNRSGTPCRLTGRVEALSGVNAGRRVPIAVSADRQDFLTPVLLQPGQVGQVDLTWYPRCDTSTGPANSGYTSLRLTLLGGVLDVTGPGLGLGCDPPQTGVSASQLGGPTPEPIYPPDPLAKLGVSLQAPASVAPGGLLRYIVTLTNTGTTTVTFSPCPTFLQNLQGQNHEGLVKDLHQLNCPKTNALPPGGKEHFAMELRVPADAPAGSSRLGWAIVGPAGANGDATTVTVTG